MHTQTRLVLSAVVAGIVIAVSAAAFPPGAGAQSVPIGGHGPTTIKPPAAPPQVPPTTQPPQSPIETPNLPVAPTGGQAGANGAPSGLPSAGTGNAGGGGSPALTIAMAAGLALLGAGLGMRRAGRRGR